MRPILALVFGMIAGVCSAAGSQAAALETPSAVVDSVLAATRACHEETDDERVEVTALASLESLDFAPPTRVTALEASTHPCRGGRVSWRVRLDDGGRTIVRVVGVEVRRLRRGLVTTRTIPRGGAIGPDDVRESWIDVTHVRTPLVTRVEALDADVSVARRILPETPLTENLLTRTPVVSLGDRVIVTVEGGGFSITLEGIARDAGAIGDEIRIKNPASGRILRAHVTGPGKAAI